LRELGRIHQTIAAHPNAVSGRRQIWGTKVGVGRPGNIVGDDNAARIWIGRSVVSAITQNPGLGAHSRADDGLPPISVAPTVTVCCA